MNRKRRTARVVVAAVLLAGAAFVMPLTTAQKREVTPAVVHCDARPAVHRDTTPAFKPFAQYEPMESLEN